jgi:hypothetical protein
MVVTGILVAVALAAVLLVTTAGVGRGNALTVPVIFGILVGGGLVVVVAAAHRARRPSRTGRRRPSVSETAGRLGLTYREEGPKGFCRDWSDLPGIRSSAKVRHVLRGPRGGRTVLGFESVYVVYTGQVNVPVAHTVYAADIPIWPTVTITPRTWMGRLARRLGRQSGLELDEPRFNRRFRVRCPDEDFALTLLAPELQHFLLEKTGVSWHLGHGRACLVYSGAMRADRIEASLDRLERFLGLVPDELHAWHEPETPDEADHGRAGWIPG